jgi:DNA polymerase-3 subunit delta
MVGTRLVLAAVTPEQAVREARSGELRPVWLLVGEERQHAADVMAAVRAAALAGGVPGLNDDLFVAGETPVQAVLAAARTLPMLARRRLVVVRSLERWEPRAGAEAAAGALDLLAGYLDAPVPTTVLVLQAGKLDGRRRLLVAAKKAGCLVECAPLRPSELPRWVEARARQMGVRLASGVAQLVAETAGPELGQIRDALERLSLFAGAGAEVDEEAVGECLLRVRTGTVWQLVDAIGERDAGRALAALARAWDPQDKDRGLPLVGTLARSARQLVGIEAARRGGASPDEAARQVGAPPFKARELAAQAARGTRADLEAMLEAWAAVDLALKGGSRRPPRAILEQTILSLCRRPAAAGRSADRSGRGRAEGRGA